MKRNVRVTLSSMLALICVAGVWFQLSMLETTRTQMPSVTIQQDISFLMHRDSSMKILMSGSCEEKVQALRWLVHLVQTWHGHFELENMTLVSLVSDLEKSLGLMTSGVGCTNSHRSGSPDLVDILGSLMASQKPALDSLIPEEVKDQLKDLVSFPLRNPCPENAPFVECPHRYSYNCSTIRDIPLVKELSGTPRTPDVYRTYHGFDGVRDVLVKVVNEKDCDAPCYAQRNKALMKEVVFHQRLDHPMLPKLLGFCVGSLPSLPMDSPAGQLVEPTGQLENTRIILVFEYHTTQQSLSSEATKRWSLHQRLEALYKITDLLVYMEKSPLGSLLMGNFTQGRHQLLLLPDNTIRLNDLSGVKSTEPICEQNSNNTAQACKFGIRCRRGACLGHNAKENFRQLSNRYFWFLTQDNRGRTDEATRRINKVISSIMLISNEELRDEVKALL